MSNSLDPHGSILFTKVISSNDLTHNLHQTTISNFAAFSKVTNKA